MKNFLVVVMGCNLQPSNVRFANTLSEATEIAKEAYKSSYVKAFIYNCYDPNNPTRVWW